MGLSVSDRLIEEGHGAQATTPVTISKKVKRVFSDSSDVATPSLELSEECPIVKEEENVPEGKQSTECEEQQNNLSEEKPFDEEQIEIKDNLNISCEDEQIIHERSVASRCHTSIFFQKAIHLSTCIINTRHCKYTC